MKKAKRKTIERKPVTVKKVALPPATILQIKVPEALKPLVVVHRDRVDILPVPKKKLSWWQSVFGE